MRRIVVLANGWWDKEWGSRELARADVLICADGGANSAIASGRMPDVVIGDLDSITGENLSQCRTLGIEIQAYRREKDETDLELALKYASGLCQERDELYVYGITGDRIDHVLGNVALLLAYARRSIHFRAKDQSQEMWIIQGREEIIGRAGQEISLIPLSESAIVSTAGLYYPLRNERLYQASTRGISNVLVGAKAVVEVHEGWVMAVLVLK